MRCPLCLHLVIHFAHSKSKSVAATAKTSAAPPHLHNPAQQVSRATDKDFRNSCWNVGTGERYPDPQRFGTPEEEQNPLKSAIGFISGVSCHCVFAQFFVFSIRVGEFITNLTWVMWRHQPVLSMSSPTFPVPLFPVPCETSGCRLYSVYTGSETRSWL